MKLALTSLLAVWIALAQNQELDPGTLYHLGPDSLPQEGVPKGEFRGPFTLPSQAYQGTQHTYWVYLPAQYDPTVPASLMIFNDGQAFKYPEGDIRANNVMDNLIYRREIPVMIGVFINPGRRPDQPEPNPSEWGDRTTNRPTEYNTLDDKYARVVTEELMPVLYKEYNISKDPEQHGIGGASSGAIAAFTVAWQRPGQFHKVLSIVGSFVNLRGGNAYADIVRKSEKKPIRIFLQDGRNDNRGQGRGGGAYDEARDWFLQNVRLMQALTEKGYEVNYTWGMNRHGQKMGGPILPEMMRWLWRDHAVNVDPNDMTERSPNAPAKKAPVAPTRVPNGGIQPQAARGPDGALHMIYFSGDPKGGDLLYVRSTAQGEKFSRPLRVNSQEGSVIAMGTIRGGQIAVDGNGRVHVAWNGSDTALPRGPVNPEAGKPGSPMLYTRLNDGGTAFEPQRNVMLHSFGLDGGGTVAADAAGNVYVAWHGKGMSAAEGEAGRQVWVAESHDAGKTFAAEVPAWNRPTGACGCCGMTLFATRAGTLLALYRSATQNVHRDIYLLASKDRGKSFQGSKVDTWEINACPMSSMSFAENGGNTYAAWETGGQVLFGKVSGEAVPKVIAAPGEGKGRKHPRLAVNSRGEVILVWTEGTGWQRGGSIAWQVFDCDGNAIGEKGAAPGLPAWSFGAVSARGDGGFSVYY